MIEENKSAEMRDTNQANSSEQLIIGESDNQEQNIEWVEIQNEQTKKVNSFHTILSIWNSMIGSSTVDFLIM